MFLNLTIYKTIYTTPIKTLMKAFTLRDPVLALGSRTRRLSCLCPHLHLPMIPARPLRAILALRPLAHLSRTSYIRLQRLPQPSFELAPDPHTPPSSPRARSPACPAHPISGSDGSRNPLSSRRQTRTPRHPRLAPAHSLVPRNAVISVFVRCVRFQQVLPLYAYKSALVS